jgi:succinoglycan biosynthesis transport protein ExoP
MDLKYYLSILWGNKWILLLTLVVTLACVIAGTMLVTPIYSASATLRVTPATTGSMSSADYAYSERLMNTYSRIAVSRPVLEELAAKLNLQTIPDVKVSLISSTELMQITVRSPYPAVAQNAANALGDILVAQSQELYSGGEKSTAEILAEQLSLAETELNQARQDYEAVVAQAPNDSESIAKANLLTDLKEKTYETLLSQYEDARVREAIRANTITIIEPAVLPLEPSQPNPIMNIGLGLIVGLVGGIGLVFLLENLNPRLRSLEQIETVTELDIIEKIPSIRRKRVTGWFKRDFRLTSSAFKGSFQKLQTKIAQLNAVEHKISSLLFTSAVPGEGKSTVVANLALAMGKAGQKVVVVDCDMRIPTQHRIFELPNKLGLSTLFTQQSKLINVMQKSRNPNTWIITSGPVVSNSMELLGSPQMRSMLEQLKQKFDYVLLDTPALLPVGDAIALGSMVDGIVLVTRQAYCKEDDLRETHKQLADLKTRLIGIVVNDVKHNRSRYYNQYGYS